MPRVAKPDFISPDEVLAIARAGAAAGCTEALFTLDDKPELRYQAARDALMALGHKTTISYLTAMCALVLRETGLLPHANPGVMTREEIAGVREVTVSQGVMLESSSDRLCQRCFEPLPRRLSTGRRHNPSSPPVEGRICCGNSLPPPASGRMVSHRREQCNAGKDTTNADRLQRTDRRPPVGCG